MKTLDRYIIRQFLINFVILTVVFGLLFILVDLLANLDEYVESAHILAELKGQPLWLAFLYCLFDYAGPILILLYVFLAGLLVNAAIGFTFSSLSHNGELVAMLTGGRSMYRIAAPVLFVGASLSLAALPIQEYVIPHLAHKLLRKHNDMAKEEIKIDSIFFAPDKRGNLISASEFDAANGTLGGVMVLMRGSSDQTNRRITAEQALWSPDKKGWILSDASIIEHVKQDGSSLREAKVSQQARYVVESDLSPDVLLVRRSSMYLRLLSSSQLHELMRNPNADRHHMHIARIIHNRYSFLVVQVLITLMAMPIFLLREPKSFMIQAIKAACICIGAWAMAIIAQQVGEAQLTLNPVAAAWLPVVLLLPLSAIMVQTIKT